VDPAVGLKLEKAGKRSQVDEPAASELAAGMKGSPLKAERMAP
jgi:hypothetical protein